MILSIGFEGDNIFFPYKTITNVNRKCSTHNKY